MKERYDLRISLLSTPLNLTIVSPFPLHAVGTETRSMITFDMSRLGILDAWSLTITVSVCVVGRGSTESQTLLRSQFSKLCHARIWRWETCFKFVKKLRTDNMEVDIDRRAMRCLH